MLSYLAGTRVGEATHPGPSDPKRTMKKKNDKTPSAIDKINTSRKCGQGDTDIDMINNAEKGHRSKGALLLETIGRDTAKFDWDEKYYSYRIFFFNKHFRFWECYFIFCHVIRILT